MDPITVLGKVADLGVVPLMALILLYWYRTDSKERETARKVEFELRLQEEREQSCRERDDKILLINTIRDITEVLSELRSIVQKLNGKG